MTVTPIPAATLVLLRNGSTAPELLAIERTKQMAFAPGAVVFPGGRIEEDDLRLGRAFGPTLPDAPARIAAIRETLEEVGIAVGFSSDPPAETVAEMRAALASGALFSDILARLRTGLHLDRLTPFARWCPPDNPVRRFDTLFFLAEAPLMAPPAVVDEIEAVRSFWASASHILDEAAAGRLHLVFPTKRNLERLAQFSSIEAMRDDAAAYPVRLVESYIEEREGAQWLCIPDGMGYPVVAERLDGVDRGWERRS